MMSFNLKALGLALIAALAMSAFAASAAYAKEEGHVVAGEGASEITGDTEAAGHGFVFSTGESSTVCDADHFVGSITDDPTKTITVKTEFGGPEETQNCTAGGFPSTVTNNGCELHFDTFETDLTEKSDWQSTVDLTCPNEGAIEVHVYLGSNHEVPVCTLTIPGQNELEGVTVDNIPADPDAEPPVPNDDLTLTVDVGGITVIQHQGIGCPSEHFTDATMKGNVTVRAFDENEEQVNLTVKHTKEVE